MFVNRVSSLSISEGFLSIILSDEFNVHNYCRDQRRTKVHLFSFDLRPSRFLSGYDVILSHVYTLKFLKVLQSVHNLESSNMMAFFGFSKA